ncbi:MAG TPA: EamA family transporter [Pyrinomonadaceae bacterium]|nr:EamA family transporter [Pyrinomonadaceae bacterium]
MQENTSVAAVQKRGLLTLVLAFAAVYLIWGSTYLAIKYAIETMPTFLMAGFRFLAAGSMLLIWARLSRSYEKPTLVHWRTSLIVGALLLGIGNGGVVLAEHYISSGLAALLVATVPFWIILLSWMFMSSGRPNWKVTAGLLVGFVGVWLLIAGGNSDPAVAGDGQMFGVIVILVSTVGWSIGSLYGAHAPTARSPILAAGMQMFSGGIVLIIIGTLAGEWTKLDLAAVSFNSWIAFIYLITFGAFVAYTAYSWLIKNASPASVSTYAYVNPAIAVVLGWAIAGETLTGRMMVGAGIIVASVALITMNKSKKAAEPEREIERPTIRRTDRPDFSTSG